MDTLVTIPNRFLHPLIQKSFDVRDSVTTQLKTIILHYVFSWSFMALPSSNQDVPHHDEISDAHQDSEINAGKPPCWRLRICVFFYLIDAYPAICCAKLGCKPDLYHQICR